MTQRMLIEVRGIVQGVGFRPRVYSLATSLDLRGFVQNRGSHVFIDAEGDAHALDAFIQQISSVPPALAAVERVDCHPTAAAHHQTFEIAASVGAPEDDIRISPDTATCGACLSELFDPTNRRFRYPFINCTNCGPRFTIVTGVPYDRARTTMRRFQMCDVCEREYRDPADRRFHAEPIACPRCGPTLVASGPGPADSRGEDAVRAAVAALLDGRIVAVKGLGGYHLACDATNEAAVAELRRRKRRDAKPFAVMLSNRCAGQLNRNAPVWAALTSRERPIVLVDREVWRVCDGGFLALNVAPGCPTIGVMLPYTPVHHLLLHDAGRPLVMTSGNVTDEPIAYEDDDARERLAGTADLFLWHERAIHARCDDSVLRITLGGRAVVRRARGYAPGAITVNEGTPDPVLAVGAHLKNTFCILSGRQAFVSPHIGDLESLSAYQALGEGVDGYGQLLGVKPAIVVHDLHPEYLSTRFAHRFPDDSRIAVQHHHAHVLSCAAEHGISEPVLGVAFDGAGLGTDGAVWGGEFLLADGTTCHRMAHLGYVHLPGGDAAAREPWRMAVAHLAATYGSSLDWDATPLASRIPAATLAVVAQMIDRQIRTPLTSSMGRLFDAVAALVGLHERTTFEGQAAMELEALAAGRPGRRYRFDVRWSSDPGVIDSRPVIRGIVEDVTARTPCEDIAAAFHEAAATMIADVGAQLAQRTGIRRIALSGGVFQNVVLVERAAKALAAAGLVPMIHRRVPCNDGGLSLGQALFAARVLRQRHPIPERSACA